ncbi:hypothetical protein [Chitinophaga sancti]|nr:hypothetical protein [Chitinophaga sancti]WQD65421.1 hypothetical protein U0033_13555 [Chitinophaga sancti]WQG88956.1 hypothetical protein SR876_28915 [Chitinophaga sancti]
MQRSTNLPGAPGKGTIVAFPRGIRQSSGNVSYLLASDTNHNLALIPVFGDKRYDTTVWHKPPSAPFLKVHGNVIYDYYYQSGVDTPYEQKDIYKHTLQTYLDVTVTDQYPIRVGFSTARGNSTLFRNITGINMQYTSRDFRNLLLQKLDKWDASRMDQMQQLRLEKTQLDTKVFELDQLKSWLSSPAQLQRLVEARERQLYSPQQLSIPKDSIPLDLLLKYKGRLKETPKDSSFEAQYAARKQKLDSLQQQYDTLYELYKTHQRSVGNMKSDIMNSRNNKELAANLKDMNLPGSILPKGYKTLLAIRNVGIGRTLVDYSELTAKNISITGVQVEYNPSWYAAVATGVVDYRFRNYIVNSDGPKQYLSLVRGGYGIREGNHVYLTYYYGKKQLYDVNSHIMGLAIEGRYQLTKNIYFTGEVAKSSLPHYQTPDSSHQLSAMLRFSDRRNEAYSVTGNAFIPASSTKWQAMYKVMGAGFQSFSLFTTGSKQVAWSVRVDQPFWRKQLWVIASLTRNNYNSSYQQSEYHSNTVFKSIQATLRIKRYPVLTVGYYPSSQLTKLSDGSYIENTFYTLVGTLSHYYKVKTATMSTMLSYTRFYNKQADSSYLYFNTRNILLNHALFVGRFAIQGTASAALNDDYNLYGGDGNIHYKVRSWMDVGAGLKYSYQTVYELREVGYSGNVRVDIPYLGQVAVLVDKGFIPGAEKRLVSNNTGRITYTKIF